MSKKCAAVFYPLNPLKEFTLIRPCAVDTFLMSEKQKPPTRPDDHMEKPVMDAPQEEFVSSESVPSHDVSEMREGARAQAPKAPKPPPDE
jgi:hypothetical protein